MLRHHPGRRRRLEGRQGQHDARRVDEDDLDAPAQDTAGTPASLGDLGEWDRVRDLRAVVAPRTGPPHQRKAPIADEQAIGSQAEGAQRVRHPPGVRGPRPGAHDTADQAVEPAADAGTEGIDRRHQHQRGQHGEEHELADGRPRGEVPQPVESPRRPQLERLPVFGRSRVAMGDVGRAGLSQRLARFEQRSEGIPLVLAVEPAP